VFGVPPGPTPGGVSRSVGDLVDHPHDPLDETPAQVENGESDHQFESEGRLGLLLRRTVGLREELVSLLGLFGHFFRSLAIMWMGVTVKSYSRRIRFSRNRRYSSPISPPETNRTKVGGLMPACTAYWIFGRRPRLTGGGWADTHSRIFRFNSPVGMRRARLSRTTGSASARRPTREPVRADIRISGAHSTNPRRSGMERSVISRCSSSRASHLLMRMIRPAPASMISLRIRWS